MATRFGQYTPVFLTGKTTLPDREAWQATVYRVTKSWTLLKQSCTHRHKTSFACGSSAPVRVEHKGEHEACGCLHHECRYTDCLHCRNYSPIKVFFWASCSWRSEGIFGQSFSISLSIQALRGLLSFGSFSVDQHIRHIEGPPGWGPTLYISASGT